MFSNCYCFLNILWLLEFRIEYFIIVVLNDIFERNNIYRSYKYNVLEFDFFKILYVYDVYLFMN